MSPPKDSRARALVVVGNSEGGGAWIALDLLGALDPARYQATLVAPASAEVSAWADSHGVTFAPLPLLNSRLGGETLSQLRAIIASERPDIIHAHGTRAAWFVTRCLPAQGAPPLLYGELNLSFQARRGALRLPWLALEAYLCRRAAAVTTCCERDARFAERFTRLPVTVRHYGIDLAEIQRQVANAPTRDATTPPFDALDAPPDAPLIGTVGRLIPQKGLRYLIAAAPAILAAAPAAHFVIVGDGPERAALEAQSRAIGLERRIHFVGAQAQPWRLLARCSVIVLSSLWEGGPLTLLEALAAGLPVATTDVGLVPEALGPELAAVSVATPRDASALARTTLRLLRDPALRERFQREGPALAARYDSQQTEQACAALYDALCGRAQGAGEEQVRR
ncbi:MAG: glycosyltransferase family 4 protein [Ktedonobacterales bacterium]